VFRPPAILFDALTRYSSVRESVQPLPLNDRLDRIGQHIVRARLFLDLWFYFEGKDSRGKIIDSRREYSAHSRDELRRSVRL
jgi:hypothetical protein